MLLNHINRMFIKVLYHSHFCSKRKKPKTKKPNLSSEANHISLILAIGYNQIQKHFLFVMSDRWLERGLCLLLYMLVCFVCVCVGVCVRACVDMHTHSISGTSVLRYLVESAKMQLLKVIKQNHKHCPFRNII